MSEIKYMPIKEFHSEGYLQEANRLFFHPLGLSLVVTADWPEGVTPEEMSKYKDEPANHPDAIYRLDGVNDCRRAPEGLYFEDALSRSKEFRRKAENVTRQYRKLKNSRIKKFGQTVQKLPGCGGSENEV